jgi:hypothetical protein
VTTAPQRIGFFGPFGTFTEQALLTQADLAASELVPYRSVPDVLDAVARGDVDAGFVPIENSIEGTVNFTQDALIFDYELLIQREVVLDIEHCLLAAAGTSLSDISVVLSIPVATAQCSAWLRDTLPNADVQAANSTADAARSVGERSVAGEKGLAAQMLQSFTISLLLLATLQTMPEIRRVLFWYRKTASRNQLVTTKQASLYFNVPMNREALFPSCKNLQHAESTCRCCRHGPLRLAVSEITASLFMQTAT